MWEKFYLEQESGSPPQERGYKDIRKAILETLSITPKLYNECENYFRCSFKKTINQCSYHRNVGIEFAGALPSACTHIAGSIIYTLQGLFGYIIRLIWIHYKTYLDTAFLILYEHICRRLELVKVKSSY